MTEHDRFGLDAANAPTEHAQPVDHRRVGVCSHQRVSEPDAFLLASDGGQKFEVDLMDNAPGRGDGLEVGERLLAPLEEGVALHVSVVFDIEVHVQRIAVGSGNVHLDGVIDDQIDRNLRVDLLGVAAHFHHRIPQSGQVNHGWHAGEVLQNNARGAEGNLGALAVGRPCGNPFDVVFGDQEAVVAPKCALEENPNGVRQVAGLNAGSIQSIKRKIVATNIEGSPGLKGVQCRHESGENPPVYEENPSQPTLD